MKRTKSTRDAAVTLPKTRGRKPSDESAQLTPAEKLLQDRYPKQRIVAGSLADSGQFPEFGHKRTVLILCQICDQPRRLATSDVFHTTKCETCKKEAGKKPHAKPAAKTTKGRKS